MQTPRTPRIDIALLAPGTISWRLGRVVANVVVSPQTIGGIFSEASASDADALLLWDPALGTPDPEVVLQLFGQTTEVHHAGLCLGQQRRPRVVDFIEPLWMHNCDVPADIESTSWRMSLRACLIRRSVLEQMSGPCAEFHSLDAVALELGFRWLKRGVFVRHTPLLVGGRELASPELDVHDELLFARRAFGSSWMWWAATRAPLVGAWNPAESARQGAASFAWPMPARETFRRPETPAQPRGNERVSVLVPTIERYPYLRVLLDQLRRQTVKPHEIVVIDQTPVADREPALPDEFRDLPLRWITLDRAGQCSSRNAGLLATTGDHILFVDDDDEVEPTLIELHLRALARFACDVSCGVAHEEGIAALPENFTFTRASDVFPTNNTMIRKTLLKRTGLFDLAYDRQQRADADLGMRVHLTGALMVLNPEVEVLHHHAPRGGLRKHRARVITYASSRNTLLQRHLPSPSELYLGKRYFGDTRVREALWQRTFGTFSAHGDFVQRVAKGTLGALFLPDTVQKMRQISASAQAMIDQRQAIPELP